MGLLTPAVLVVVLLAVASTDSSADQQSTTVNDADKTTENGQSASSASIDKNTFTENSIPNGILGGKVKENDGKGLAPDMGDIFSDLLLFESIINDGAIAEGNQKDSISGPDNSKKATDNVNNSENPNESKISTDFIDIRRQNSENEKEKSSSEIEFDDSKQEPEKNSSPRYGQRKSKQRAQDGAPILQLTQGGYDRPFTRTRFRNRLASRPDSSEQSSKIQELGGNSNVRRPETRRIAPQVTYVPSPQLPSPLGHRPMNPGFEAPARNMLAVHQMGPTTIPSRFFTNAPTGFVDYTNSPFRAQFPPSNEVGGFANFVTDTNNAALYQVPQRNPFQTTELLFQNSPEVQTQAMTMDPGRNIQPQFQQSPFSGYQGFDNVEGNSGPNYGMYFRNPTASNQFQVPPNFFTTPSGISGFNSPPINFLSNYPNTQETLAPRIFRHPVMTDAQKNQQNIKDQQQLDSDASQEEKKANLGTEMVNTANRDNPAASRFGTRLQVQNEDVYMRYPTIEAGYAIEEKMPPQNNSNEAKDNGQQTSSEQRSIPSADPFRNSLNSVRTNQRINNSYDFAPRLFRDVPIDFGYSRPQNQIFSEYPPRNRGISRYPNSNFESRNRFDRLESLPENNYQIHGLDNQRRGHKEFDSIPSCAKKNNASFCFEDKEYPTNDILYSLNSNSFLTDRLSGPPVELNSVVFVERNATVSEEKSENYACDVDTKYGSPLRARNLAGAWRIIVNLEGKFSQSVRMEVCKSLGDPCNHINPSVKTTCVQKYSMQRFLSWSPGRDIHSDVFKIPVACSCQILGEVKTSA